MLPSLFNKINLLQVFSKAVNAKLYNMLNGDISMPRVFQRHCHFLLEFQPKQNKIITKTKKTIQKLFS